MSDRKPYKSDLSDERWALVEPVIAAWKARHPSVSGHQGNYAMREIVNAILYQSRTGCQWDYLPHDLPPPGAVKYYFYKWRDDGTDQALHELLRCSVRERAGRWEDPSLVVLDTQSVHAAVNVPAATTGRDAAKKVPGRKRGLAVDVLGLVVAVVVLAASAHDNDAGTALLDEVAVRAPSVSKALVDQGFKQAVVRHGLTLGVDVEIVERNRRDIGFVPQPIRWRIEQTLGTLILHRRLVRDYESRPASSVSRVFWAETDRMTRRLSGTTAMTWRTPAVADEHPRAAAWAIGRLFARIAEREAELTGQADMLRAEIDRLTARLNDIERDLGHVRITRQTADALADGLDRDAPSEPEPELPEHPLYPQILAVLQERQQPMRARDLCESLDLGLLPKNIEGIRSKLKRLVARGILTETEPGLFTQNRP